MTLFFGLYYILIISPPPYYYIVYLIVVFVGLVVVVLLAIMLSAWCCKGKEKLVVLNPLTLISFLKHKKGAFKNPLCCPCYLCACCGGLGMAFIFLLLYF